MLTLYVPTYDPITDEAEVTLTDEKGEVLAVRTGGQFVPLRYDDYYIKQKASGLDELWFSVNVHDDAYKYINELSEIIADDGQAYLVRKIDGGPTTATVEAGLDLDAWKEGMHVEYNSDSLTCAGQIEAVAPSGWTVTDYSGSSIRRTIEGDFTPFDIVLRCAEVYGVYMRFNTVTKVLYLYPQAAGEPLGKFATRQLNLKQLNYKGKAEHEDFCTRLYCYGKDGLTFSNINGGLPYVENTEYCGRIISAVWRDERYTVAENLLEDGKRKLREMALPTRTYDCDVVDLEATNPEKYNFLDFALFASVLLVDEYKGNAITYQIVERWNYPHYPEKNKVIFSDVPVSVQGQVVQIKDAMTNPSSVFQQTITAAASANATSWLTSSNGYVVAVQNTDGSWKELLFMDTNNTETAVNVLRLNENGLGFSTSGVNGPYTNAWTIDGQLVADFITAGTMLADRIRGGTLELGGFANQNGVLLMLDANGAEIGRWNMNGISANAGEIGGWTISPTGLSCSVTSDDITYTIAFKPGTGGNVFTIGKSGSAPGFQVMADGAVHIEDGYLVVWPTEGDGNSWTQIRRSPGDGGENDVFSVVKRNLAVATITEAGNATFETVDATTHKASGYSGATGTFTASGHTLTIRGGIITGIS